MPDQIQDQSGETQQPAGQTPPAQQQESQETLIARIGGLNKAYNAKQAEWQAKFEKQQAVIADLTMRQKDAETQGSDLAKKLEALSTEKATFETQAKELGTKAATYEAQLARTKMFMLPEDQGGYADLAHFEAKGLLKDNLTGDDLTKYLQEYRATIRAGTQAAVKQTIQGGTPPAAPAKQDGEVDANVLQAQIDEALKKNDMAAFERLNKQWVELKLKK